MAVFGDTLRQARAYKGVTLKEAEQATRINRHHLAALEEENFGVLPPLIYQRGIVRNYATYLALDPGKLLGMFEEARGGGATTELVAAVKPLDMPNHWAPNFAIIAFMVVMSAIVFAWVYSATVGQDPPISTEAAIFPTVTPLAADAQLSGLPPSPTPESALGGAVATPSPTVRIVAADIAAATREPTPSPTARAVATTPPRATATTAPPAPVAPSPTPEPAVEAAPVPTEPPVAQEAEQAATDGALTILITANADLYLTFSGDGAPLYDGPLTAGQSVGPFSADQFYGQTTDAANTAITNLDTGLTFPPQNGEFSLP